MPTLDVSELNVVVSVLVPAVLFGIVLGPVAAKFLDAKRWGSATADQQDAITLGVMRVMIGIQLVIAGYQLPAKYIRLHYKDLIVCLVPIMALMWLATSICVLATIPKISLLATLVIGACVTSTDPILSQAVAKGPFADKYVARPLREIISAEAGANDGFASPFLMLAVNLLRLTENRRETLVERSRGVGNDTKDVGIALGNWIIETLLYIVVLAIVYGAVTGYCARMGVRFSLFRRWVDSESYLLFPTALGLFIVGTCGAIGTSDLLACFVAGCALNWDGQFLAETERRHDEVNSCIDVMLNFGGFMYIGATLPWPEFHQPATTGITYARLFGLGFLVLLFRRVPALLLTYKIMPKVVKNWREAIFMGYFGPIGVGAVYYLQHTRLLFPKEGVASSREHELLDAICPVVYFLVLFSIVVHGISIPILSAIYRFCHVRPITEDAVEIRRRSIYMAPPANAFNGGRDTFIVYNRFFRPLVNIVTLPLARPRNHSDNDINSETEKERRKSQSVNIQQVDTA
ncbi:hypothetical protein AAE478_010607 [Parahypoxylon ruwenzoriense]